MTVLSRLSVFTKKHPIIRGIISYAAIWPTSCLIQQTFAGKRWDSYDWGQVVKFSLYGGLYTAPTLYGWIKISSKFWPHATLRSAVTKALVEQVTYGPFAMVSFFFGMSILDGKTAAESVNNVKNKFWSTYQVGFCFWPIVQTINFLYIKERNRVAFVSVGSLVWCCFLSFMHDLQIKKQQKLLLASTSS